MKPIETDTEHFHVLDRLPRKKPFKNTDVEAPMLQELEERGAIIVGENESQMSLRGYRAVEEGRDIPADLMRQEANVRVPYSDESIFNFTCPVCSKKTLVVGQNEQQRLDEGMEHIMDHHSSEELQKFYYAREIAHHG